jgi:hypothetical protein
MQISDPDEGDLRLISGSREYPPNRCTEPVLDTFKHRAGAGGVVAANHVPFGIDGSGRSEIQLVNVKTAGLYVMIHLPNKPNVTDPQPL